MSNATEVQTVHEWWITTGKLKDGAVKVAGPYESSDRALNVRVGLEKAHNTDQYWVDSLTAPGAFSGPPLKG